MNWKAVGALLVALAVGLGAFGAHGLRGRLDAYSMDVFERGVFYHFIHALGILLAVALTPREKQGLVCTLMTAGILFFSGSLYLLAVTGHRWLGAITPIGGVAFIAAWVMFAWASKGKQGS